MYLYMFVGLVHKLNYMQSSKILPLKNIYICCVRIYINALHLFVPNAYSSLKPSPYN